MATLMCDFPVEYIVIEYNDCDHNMPNPELQLKATSDKKQDNFNNKEWTIFLYGFYNKKGYGIRYALIKPLI